MQLFANGGWVRDMLRGVTKISDKDFTVVGPASYEEMVSELESLGYEIFVNDPEHLTCRAHFPRDHESFGKVTADYVLARKDGIYKDNRHPESVELGDLKDDLARRDFRMNAMAMEVTEDGFGELVDPHGGQRDVEQRLIQFVGDPWQRLDEDVLRALRAYRFAVTLNFRLHSATIAALADPTLPERLATLPAERVEKELHKMFLADTMRTLRILNSLGDEWNDAIFRDNKIKLRPTMAQKWALPS
jgi:poly(A) polymerase